MQKIIGLGIAVLFSGFVLNSCDPWEDETYHEEDILEEEIQLPGTWKLHSLLLGESYDFNGDGEVHSDLMLETGCYQNELLTFNPDFTGLVISNSYADISGEEGNYEVECIEETEEDSFIWVQTANTVAITLNGDVLNAVLENNTLTFVIPEGFSASDWQGNMTLLQDITFIYKKVQ